MNKFEELKKDYNGKFMRFAEGRKENLTKVIEAYANSKNFDAPDGYYIDGNVVYIFEHFEFDSTKRDKKGSQTKKEISRIKRENEKHNLKQSQLNISHNSIYYLENVYKTFCDHYMKIANYKKNLTKHLNLKDEFMFKIIFVIEDSSIFGTQYIRDKKLTNLPLCFCEEFINLFEKSDLVDYVICNGIHKRDKVLYVMDHSSLDWYKESSIKISENEIMNWKPQFLSCVYQTNDD